MATVLVAIAIERVRQQQQQLEQQAAGGHRNQDGKRELPFAVRVGSIASSAPHPSIYPPSHPHSPLLLQYDAFDRT